MKTFIAAFILSASSHLVTFGQVKPDYKARMGQIMWNIQKVFYDPSSGLFVETNGKNEKPHSFLWPLCALVQAADEVERVLQGRQYMKPVLTAIDQYKSDDPPAPGYQAYVRSEGKDSRFYDDNQWIAIACLDAYERTKDTSYLSIARKVHRFQMSGYDDLAGGGLYWKEDEKNTKNTCSNGPAILIALRLYALTGEKDYFETGKKLFDWTKKTLRSPEGIYYDAIKIPGMKIDSARYTYNTGTMLEANVLLYKATGDKIYLEEARLMAIAARRFFYKNGRLPDHYWFNAVLLRGFEALGNVDGAAGNIQMFADDAERIWKEERSADGLLGHKPTKSLIDQAAMLEIYGRLARLNP
jgi:hypothetical protein